MPQAESLALAPGGGWELRVRLAALVAAPFALALLSITQAYRIAVVSTVAPFEYVYILWASLIGYLMFSDVPATRTILGSALVVACGCYLIYREGNRRRVAEPVGAD